MGMRIDTEKVMVWDHEQNQMVVRTEVSVSVVGNKGTVFAYEGPLLCRTAQDIHEATHELKERLFRRLPTAPEQPDRII